MRVRISVVAAAAVALLAASVDAAQITIPTTGYTQDIVVETGAANFTGAVTGTMDGGAGSTGGFTWYQTGQNTAAPTTGLPMGTTFVSAADPTTTFTLQSGTGNNALLLNNGQTGTLTLTTPANYSALSVLTSTGSGNNTLALTIHFVGGTTQTITGIASPDWFGNTPVAIGAGGRVQNNGTNGFAYDAVSTLGNNPNLYQENVTGVQSALNITSIDFAATGTGHTTIMALSGTPAPEPTSLSLLALGGLGLLARRRRSV